MSEPIRVVLVDDQQMVRAGFRMVIDSQPDLTVVGEAGTARQRSTCSAGRRPTWC